MDGAKMNVESIARYGLKRMMRHLGILLGVCITCFFIIEAIPLDWRIRSRFSLFLVYIDPEEYRERYIRYGFEMGLLEEDGTPIPVLKRFLQWIGFMKNNKGEYNGLLQGKLGISLTEFNKTVESVIMPNVWFTILFNTFSFTILTITTIFVGTIFFITRNVDSKDDSKKEISQRIIILPVFVLSIFFIVVFSQVFGVEIVNNDNAIVEPFILNKELYKYLILPTYILILWATLFAIKITANNAKKILTIKYQTKMNESSFTQREKIGVIVKSQSLFCFLYFRNNLSIIYSILSLIEVIFKLPGLGTMVKIYGWQRDLPSLLACMILYSLILIIHKFLMDMILACFDSRILSGEIKFNNATISNRWIHHY